MDNKKRIIIMLSTLIVIVLSIITTGCTSDKSKIKLLNQKDILKYVKRNYGTAIIEDKNITDDSAKYTLSDKEYNFKYNCTSYKKEICIAASCSGNYERKTSCDFEENYKKYIVDKLNLNNIVEIYSNPNLDKILLSLHYASEADAKNDINNVIKKIKSIDKRNYFVDYNIEIYDTNEQEIDKEFGVYNIKTGEYTSVYDKNIEQMTYSFAVVVHGTTNDKSGIRYLYYKRVQYKDVEGLKMEWLHDKSIKADDWTVAYYFDYKGTTYFIIPDIVFIENEDGIDRNHYSEQFTNYWFNRLCFNGISTFFNYSFNNKC